MKHRKAIALFLLCNMLVSIFAFLTMIPISESKTPSKASISTTTYPNSDVASLWVRKNGTDPFPFDFYDGANVSPSYGMVYFGTNVIQITWDYNFTEISSSIFPDDSVIYIQTQYDTSYYTALADYAFADSIAKGHQRIRGAFIDDFQVGLQSPSNMSAFSTALHHEDANLTYNLTLGIIVYNRNYMNQGSYVPSVVYDWYEIEPYFDIIHFWYYPFKYSLLYNGLIGYEDDFLWLHNLLPTKEYWLGIYLHYYNIGSYELNFTREEMAIAGKLIKEGYATRYSILENFWIQHHPQTSTLVKDFINDELKGNYTSTWYVGTQTTLSYSNGNPSYIKYITDIGYPNSDSSVLQSWTFHSTHLQNLTVYSAYAPQRIYTGGIPPYYLGSPIWTEPTDDYILYNMRTGDWNYPIYYDIINSRVSYILQPDQTYRIMNRPLTPYTIWANTTYTTPQTWDKLLVTIYGMIHVNNTVLTITDSIVQFGNPNTNNSMYYGTSPWYGLKIGTNSMHIYISDSIIEPKMRAYPYYFDRPYSLYDGDNSDFKMSSSILAGYSYRFRPAGLIDIDNSTFFQVQPLTGNYPSSLWLQMTDGYSLMLHFNDNIVWNYPASNVVGIFLMPYNLYGTWYTTNWGHGGIRFNTSFGASLRSIEFERNTIIGGNYGLWIDMAYSGTTFTFTDYNSYASTGDPMFTTFRLDGSGDETITVHTHTIFNWSVKGSTPGPTFSMYYPYLRNGIYVLTTDYGSSNIAVDTGTLTINNNDWRPYRNNYTLSLYGTSIDTEGTFENLIWLLFIFLAPIGMAQVAPKIGFIFGMILMLLITFVEDFSFLPYMFVSMTAIVLSIYKSR